MASKKKPPAAPKKRRPSSPTGKAAVASVKTNVKAPTRATSSPPPGADNSAAKPEPIYGDPIEFVLPRGVDRAKTQTRSGGRGAAPPLPEGLRRGQVIHALRFTSTSRSGGEAVGTRRAEAVPGRDLVALHLGQGLKLYLHPQTAAEVLQPGALAAGKRGGGGGKRSVEVKAQLLAPSLQGSSRGLGDKIGRVILEGMDIIKDAALDVVKEAVSGLVAGQLLDKAAEVAALKAAEMLDAQVVPGVYALSSDHLDNLKESQATPLLEGIPAAGDLDEPILVLVHGTFSNTAGAFGALWKDHPRVVEELFDKYDDRVYGLEHATLTVSPVINALDLAKQLPVDAKVHLLTHSRGGLVAEVLACVAQDRAGAQKSASMLNETDRAAVEEIAKLVAERNITVERIVRVACPASGTTLASKRLDAYMSVFEWTLRLAQMPVVPELLDFIATVAQYRCDDATMPGLAAQVPDSALIKWLRASPADGALRVLAGDIEARSGDGEMFSILAWAKQLLSDAFYWEDNDLVVQTASMFGGGKRDGAAATYALSRGPDVSHGRYFRNAESARLVSQALLSDKPNGFKPISDRQRLAEVGETKVEARSRGGRSGRRGAATDSSGRMRVPLSVRVVNGNLMFAKDPLMVGHYRSSEFAGSEKAVNQLIGGSMQVALNVGIYPERPGSYQLFRNTQPKLLDTKLPTPPSVVVLGLGDESQLRPQELVATVRQAVLGWAQRTYEIRSSTASSAKAAGALGESRLSSTLVASGGTGISPGQSAQLIVKGVDEANQLLGQINEQLKPDRRWPVLTQLVFIELYLDRASEALRALKGMPEVTRGDWIIDDVVTPGDGALRRPPDAGYRGADYDLISVRTSEGDQTGARLEYALDTRRARTEMRAQSTQAALVRKLVQRASNDDNTDVQLSKTLYQLLIPRTLDAYFSGSTQMRIELDDSTSGLPWEFLDPGDTVRKAEDGKGRKAEDPWAIRTRLIRKLRMADFREDVRDANQSSGILIIGEPKTPEPDLKADPPFEGYARLPGAANEARAVSNILLGRSASGEDGDDNSAPLADDEIVDCLIAGDGEYPDGPDAQAVVNKLLERDWKVVHIAGHGEAPISPTHLRGVVLSDGFLGPDEMRSMRIVPQLVFVNCCHLARGDDRHLMRTTTYNRVDFASGVARALIETGVKCVVAAGWAVDDECAKVFATTFYRSLRGGKPFVDAVFDARKAAYDANRNSNTWAAYQCYGDPDWTLNVTVPVPDESEEILDEQRRERFGAIASPQALVLTLEVLINEAAYMRERADSQSARSPQRILGDVDYLVGTVAERHLWMQRGDVAQAIGQAYETLGQFKKAVEAYQAALTAKDGGATHKVLEKFANLLIRYVEEEVRLLAERAEKAKKLAARRPGAVAKVPTLALTDKQNEDLKVAKSLLLRLVEECHAGDPRLPERLTLQASACKREALIALSLGQPQRAATALKEMQAVTKHAAEAARECKSQEIYYPLLNQIVAHVALHATQKSAAPLPVQTVDEIRAALRAKNDEDPDFWSAVNEIELAMYEHVTLRRLATASDAEGTPAVQQIEQSLNKLHSQIQDNAKWRSVHDTARLGLGLYVQVKDHPENERRAAAELLAQIGKYAELASR